MAISQGLHDININPFDLFYANIKMLLFISNARGVPDIVTGPYKYENFEKL